MLNNKYNRGVFMGLVSIHQRRIGDNTISNLDSMSRGIYGLDGIIRSLGNSKELGTLVRVSRRNLGTGSDNEPGGSGSGSSSDNGIADTLFKHTGYGQQIKSYNMYTSFEVVTDALVETFVRFAVSNSRSPKKGESGTINALKMQTQSVIRNLLHVLYVASVDPAQENTIKMRLERIGHMNNVYGIFCFVMGITKYLPKKEYVLSHGNTSR